MMKHWLINHKDESLEEERFSMRIIKYTRSAFERQILESVKIQEERKTSRILNSKAEYNRCAIPRLSSNLGGKTVGDAERMERDEMRKEEELEDQIRKMRKEIMARKRQKDREGIDSQKSNKKPRLTFQAEQLVLGGSEQKLTVGQSKKDLCSLNVVKTLFHPMVIKKYLSEPMIRIRLWTVKIKIK